MWKNGRKWCYDRLCPRTHMQREQERAIPRPFTTDLLPVVPTHTQNPKTLSSSLSSLKLINFYCFSPIEINSLYFHPKPRIVFEIGRLCALWHFYTRENFQVWNVWMKSYTFGGSSDNDNIRRHQQHNGFIYTVINSIKIVCCWCCCCVKCEKEERCTLKVRSEPLLLCSGRLSAPQVCVLFHISIPVRVTLYAVASVRRWDYTKKR